MSVLICPACHFEPLPAGAASCPSCGTPLDFASQPAAPGVPTHIEVQQTVEHAAQGSTLTGVQIGQVRGSVQIGFSASEVQELLSDLEQRFQLRPYSGENPYLGLASFQESDAGRFFGRERLVTELLARLKDSRFILVGGPSGSGKSSLVRAGLIPTLKQGALPAGKGRQASDNWRYATLTPGRAPLESLGQALSGLAGSLQPLQDFRQAPESLPPALLGDWVEVVLGEGGGRRLAVFIDQFEEIFTLRPGGEDAQRNALIQQLVGALERAGSRLVLLLAMRSDFVSACAPYTGLNRLLNQGFFQVGPLAPDELVSAIVRPALQVGVRVDPQLVAQVVADMSGEPGALPLMQFALQELFEAEKASGGVAALTLDGYLQRGGLQRALERYADGAFQSLDSQDQALAARIFAALVVPGQGRQDTARTALLEELAPAGANPERVLALVRRLADARLVTTGEMEAGEAHQPTRTVRLAHERLLEAWPWLRRLVDENRSAIALQNDIEEDARRWDENQRDESYLYAGARLATAEERLREEQIALSQLAFDFIESARQHRLTQEQERTRKAEEERQRELDAARELAEAERQRAQDQALSARRIRRWAIGLAAAAVIAAMLGVLALISQSAARRSEQTAQANAFTATYALGESETLGTQVADKQKTAESAQATAVYNQQQANLNAEQAERQASLARAGELAAQAQLAYDVSLSRSALLAVEASRAYTPSIPAAEQALRQVVQESVRMLLPPGEADPTYSLAIDESGSWLATGTGSGRVLLWRVPDSFDSGPSISLPDDAVAAGVVTLVASNAPVTLLRFSADAFASRAISLAYATEDGKAALLMPDLLEDGFGLADFTPARVIDMLFLPDGSALLLFTSAGELYRWSTDGFYPQGEPVLVFASGESASVAAISPTGHFLAAAQGTTFQLWSLDGASPVRENLMLTNSDIETLRFSQSERWLAVAEGLETVYLWDLSASKALAWKSFTDDRFNRTRIGAFQILFDARSQQLAVVFSNGATRIWALADPDLIPQDLSGSDLNLVSVLTMSKDGRWLAAGAGDGRLRLWDAQTGFSGPPARVFAPQDNSAIEQVLISPDSRWLFSASQNGALALHALGGGSGDPISADGYISPITQVVIDPQNRWIASSDIIGYSSIYHITPAALELESLPRDGDGWVQSLAFSNSGRWLAAGGYGAMQLLDVGGDSPELVREYHLSSVNHLAFSPDEHWLAVDAPEISLYSLSELDADPLMLSTPDISVSALDWSPDSRWLAAGFEDGALRLWMLDGAAATMTGLTGHTGAITALYFDTRRDRLLSLDSAGAIFTWKLDGTAQGEQLQAAEDPADVDHMVAGALRPGGEWVAKSRGFDFGIYLESLSDPDQAPRVLRGHDSAANQLVFSQDGRYLASAGQQIYLWDLSSSFSTPVKLLETSSNFNRVAFGPDGRWLAAGVFDGAQGSVYLWRVRSGDLISLACQLAGRNLTYEEWYRFFPGQGFDAYRPTCP